MRTLNSAFLLVSILCATANGIAGDGNRLAYLDENNPWYPHTGFAKLTTPLWVGEEGVEAVVILAIDDMRDTAKYEAYLRPILQRLKAIDGRAPVSIMTCDVKPDDPQLQSWLGEGLSIECHTIDHPCPLLQGDLAKAKSTYDRCVDRMYEIPGNTPVAFRTPCCDSLNTVSPRFFAEIFNSRTPGLHHLQIDSSVFCVFTEADPDIPAELLTDPDGTPKFRKYLPKGLERGSVVHNEFVNWIENYPYPYVINGNCWEFPCMVPSDWEANFHHEPNNPDTVRDMQAALDITVLKQGVFCMVFHPHGWITAEQMVEFIDHAVETHGEKAKFLTFREALARLNANLLDGGSLRDDDGHDAGVRLIDLNGDRLLDVIQDVTTTYERPKGNVDVASLVTKVWRSDQQAWQNLAPTLDANTMGTTIIVDGDAPALRFGIGEGGEPFFFHSLVLPLDSETDPEINFRSSSAFRAGNWDSAEYTNVRHKEERVGIGVAIWRDGADAGTRLRDLDGDGACEMIATVNGNWNVFWWGAEESDWLALEFSLPAGTGIVDVEGHDTGLRFVDLNGDASLDIIQSSGDRYGVWLFKDMETGWSIEVMSGTRGDKPPQQELPPIVRADGTDNGFFIHSGYLLWQNEDTAHLPDMVEKRSIADLLKSLD